MRHPIRWTAIRCAGMTLISSIALVTSPSAQADDLAKFVPDNVLFFAGHAGQKSIDKMSNGTAWGDLRAEPEVKRFEEAMLIALDQAILKAAEDEHAAPIYRDVKRLANVLYTHPTALAIYSIGMGEQGPSIQAALICRSGAEEADRLVKVVDQLFQRLEAPPAEIALVGANSMTRVALPIGEGLYYGKIADAFVLTIGETTAKDLAARLSGKSDDSLASAKMVTLGRRHIGGGDDTRATMVYLNSSRTLDVVRTLMPMLPGAKPEQTATLNKVIAGIGLDSLDGILWENHYRDGGCVSGLFQYTPEGGTGFFKPAESKLTDADLRRIPKNVAWASAFKFDLADAYRSIIKGIKEIPGMSENVDQGLEMVQGMIGFKIDEEFLSLLDDTWIIYDTHDSGGLLFTGITASIKVKDGEQFASRIDALIQMAGTQAPRGTPMGDLRIETRTLTHGDHKVTFLNMAGLPIGMAPAWTVDGDQLIVGLYPQMVTSALDRLSETDSGEDSILGHPDVIRARKLIGEPESSWSYVDMKAGIETMYPLSLVLLQMGTSMAQGQGVDIDISAVPSLRTLTRHIFGEVRSTRQVEGGALSIAFGPWPMPANPGVSINAATLSLGTAILLPTLAKAREHSKRTVCGANLRGIGQCLFIYANDHKDQFPDDLTALIKADLCSPEQFVCPGTTAVMPDSPSAEEIEACYIYIPGQFASYGPEDVLVYERPENHDHEGANVLFGDGHVVFIRDMDKLDKMVAKTKAKFAARRKEKSPETDRR